MQHALDDNTIGLLTAAESQRQMIDMNTAKLVAEALHGHYPGHLWAVTCDQGLITVRDLYLSGKWGFVLKMSELATASELKAEVIKAGGEILERYNVRRGRFDINEYRGLEKDFSGNFKADKS